MFIELQEKDTDILRHKVEVVTLHPTSVFGPTLLADASGSIEGILKIFNRTIPGIPEMWLPIVDVRDAAESHIKALLKEPWALHG